LDKKAVELSKMKDDELKKKRRSGRKIEKKGRRGAVKESGQASRFIDKWPREQTFSPRNSLTSATLKLRVGAPDSSLEKAFPRLPVGLVMFLSAQRKRKNRQTRRSGFYISDPAVWRL